MTNAVLTSFDSAPFEIIDGDRGKNYPKQNEFSSSGHCLFLNANNVTRNGFEFSDCQFISEQKDEALRKGKLQREDVVLTTRGTIGNSAYYNVSIPYDNMRINSGMVILRCDRNQMLPTYLFHFLRSPLFHGQVNSLRSGVAQPQLPIRDMKRIKLPLPPLSEQIKVASILSAYDDLIENNRRRIQLLEQAARLLYKEWFVHLHFPGHEHVKIKNGVPAGWEKKRLGDIAPLHYGKALKKDDRMPGPFPVYGSSGVVGTHIKAMVSGPTIIVGRKGNIGSVHWSSVDCHPIDTVYYINTSNCSYYLYYALQQVPFISTDVAVPGLNRDFAHSKHILVPESKLYRIFEGTVAPQHQQIDVLRKANVELEKARDLLLPRLMSGEIAV